MNIFFHFYGFLIGIGIITSATVSSWLSRRRNYPPNIIWDSLFWIIIPAIIGARLYHVFDLWNDYYRFNLLNSLYVWNGGLAIFGALLGGFLGLFLYYKLKIEFAVWRSKLKIQFPDLLNLIVFGLPLAQAIGRLGNYFNQELYGLSSSLPWAIRIGNQTYHPLFAYESLWLLIGFFIMYLSERGPSLKPTRNARKDGPQEVWIANCIRKNYFAFYLIWYGFGRFFLEFLRPAEFKWNVLWGGFVVDLTQVISIIMIILGGGGLLF